MWEPATKYWPAALIAICLALPFAIDPSGLRPFLPLKSTLLLVGAASAALLASLAWLLGCFPRTRQHGDGPKADVRGARVATAEPATDFKIVIAAGLFLGWVVLAPLMVAANPELHLLGVAELLAAATLGVLTALAVRCDRRWRFRLVATLAFTAVLMAIHALLQTVGLDPLGLLLGMPPQAEGRWRIFTTAGNPNWTGAYLACTAPLVAWLARHRKSPMLETMVWGLFTFAVLLTGSRLALIALVAGGICWWRTAAPVSGSSTPSSSLRKGIAVVALLAVLGVALVVFGGELAERWGDLRSIGGRLVSFGAAAHLVFGSPIAGQGLGHFPLSLPDGLRQLHAQVGDAWFEWWPRSLTAHVHNDFLEMGVEAGLGGALLLAALWGLAFIRSRRQEPAVAAALLSLAVLAAASVPLQIPTTTLLFSVLIGLAAILPAIPAEESRRAAVPGIALRWLVTLVLLGVVVVSFDHGLSVLQANRTAKTSRALLAAGDFGATETGIREVLAATPWDHESGAILAALEVDKGRAEEALEILDSIDRWLASRGAWLVRARAMQALGLEMEAVEVLEAGVAALPDFLRAHYLLGNLYTFLGDPEGARAAYERVLESPQDSSVARVFKDRARRALSEVP